jgi:trk system potassium uptake protein TrkA
MTIVIAGAGKVGFQLARALSTHHQVTVIDQNAEALNRLQELIDIFPVHGNIENPQTYAALLETKADIFIAVSDSDEANLISTLLIDDHIEVERKIIRLRNSYFSESETLSNFGNLQRIFPFQLAAETIRALLAHPEANNVKTFAMAESKLISIKVDNPVHEEKQVGLFENEMLKVVGIERNKFFFVPDKEEVIVHNDLLYFLGNSQVLDALYGELDLHMPQRTKNAVIFGAKTLGVEIAKVLIDEGVQVKLVEKDITYCHSASEALQDKALIINSRYDEAILYEEENLSSADMVITAGTQDETNIIQALQAKEQGIPKVIAINNEPKYYALMHQLGIVVSRGPRTSAYYTILESLAAHGTMEKRHFCGGGGIVLSRKIQPLCSLIGKPICQGYQGLGILLIERQGKLLIVNEQMLLDAHDTLFFIITAEKEKEAEQWIGSL